MKITDLKKDPEYITNYLKELDDGSVICLKDCKIQIPVRYEERNLAYIGSDNHILGIYGIIMDDRYACSLINSMISIDPLSTEKIKNDDEEYYQFNFEKGNTVIKTVNLVKTATLTYSIFDEFFAKGYVPWFLNTQEDLVSIYDTALYHAGANVGSNKAITRLLVSFVSRDPINKTKFFRYTLNENIDNKDIKPAFVPLKSVELSATSTLNKIGGNYFDVGVKSALVNPSSRTEKIEDILRR